MVSAGGGTAETADTKMKLMSNLSMRHGYWDAPPAPPVLVRPAPPVLVLAPPVVAPPVTGPLMLTLSPPMIMHLQLSSSSGSLPSLFPAGAVFVVGGAGGGGGGGRVPRDVTLMQDWIDISAVGGVAPSPGASASSIEGGFRAKMRLICIRVLWK